jgi:uncharacterized membrane protein
MFIKWATGAIVGGRRLQGKTFLAPIKSQAYAVTGVIDPAVVTSIVSATATLVAANALTIWHRPDPVSHTGGSSSAVNGATVPNTVTSLATRRR